MSRVMTGISCALALCASTALVQAQSQTSPAAKSAPATQSISAQGSGTAANVPNNKITHSKEMTRLMEAAQRLRDAIHAIAQRDPGSQRTQAIKQADKALLDTQRAMLDIPPELRTVRNPEIGESEAMKRLEEAAQKLRDATHAMAAEPAGPRRNAAIKQANEALLETQQTMIDILPNQG